MKKNRLLTFSFTILAVFAVTACGSNSVFQADLDPYTYEYEPPFEDEYDSDMKIDGALEEAKWVGKNYLYYSEYNVDIQVTTFFTDFGVYIGGKATDAEMTYYGRFDMKNNSGMDIFLARNTQTLMQNSEIMRLQVDAHDRKSYYQDRFAGVATVEGELNTHTTCTMTFEMFVSWKEMGYKGYVPSTVKIVPSYRYVYRSESASNIERHNITPTFGESTYMSGYLTFNKNGYANPDIQGCPLGNAKNGVSKSDGWDLSHYADENPYVASNFRNCQSIYFKNVYAENFVAEVDVEMVSPLGTINNPKFGLIAHGYGYMNFRAMYIRGIVDNALYYESGNISLMEMTFYPNRTYLETGSIFQESSSPLALTDNFAHLKMIKNGDTLMMFVGSTLVYSESAEWYKGEMSPGLFAMDVEARFYNYRASALSDNELASYLKGAKVSAISIPPTFSGGIITAEKNAIAFGGELTLNIKPNVGYILSELYINDVTYFEDYCSKVTDAQYSTSSLPREGILIIDAIFTKISSKNGPYCYGKIVSSNNGLTNIPYADITISSSTRFLFFADTSSSNGSYYLDYLPSAGTKILTVGGISYFADGYYNITIRANGYRSYTAVYYVDDQGYHFNDAAGDIIPDGNKIALSPRVVGGSVSSSNFSYVSDLTGWDLSREDQGVVVANRGSSNNPLYFSNVTSSRAIIKMTIEDDTPVASGYDPQPSMGISMQTGGFRLGVVLDGSNVRLLPNFEWLNDSDHLISTNNMFRTNDKNPIGFMLIKDGTFVAVLVSPSNDGNYEVAYAGIWEDFGNLPIAYGLYSRSSGFVNNIFSNFSIETSEEELDKTISEHLTGTICITNGEHGTATVRNSTGQVYENGDSISLGNILSVNVEADEGYYVYGVKYNGKFLPLEYKNEARSAYCSFAYTPGQPIEIVYDSMENKGKEIRLTMSSQDLPSHLESLCNTTEKVSGLGYRTSETISSDSFERNIQTMMATSQSDYSSFVSLEYEIIEGFTNEKMVPYVVDNEGRAFKIGGARNEWSATRTANGETTSRTSSNWQGFQISGGCHATYTVSLEGDMYYDPDVSTKFGATSAGPSLNKSNIFYLGIQNYAYFSNNWEYTLLAIRGVNASGEKTLLFDGSQADIKEANGAKESVSEANDAMLWYLNGSGSVNYQYLELVSNEDLPVLTDGAKSWQINYGNSGDGYSWNNLVWDTDLDHVNLHFYDAIAFDVDFSPYDWGDVDTLEMQIELRYDDFASNNKNASRNWYVYLLDESGNATRCRFTDIPTTFKGTIVVLFEDFSSISLLSNHLFNIMTSSRLIIKTTEDNNHMMFDLWNIRIISNGAELVKG